MEAKSVEKRRIIHTEDILDLARSRASGREQGMTPEPLDEAGDLGTDRATTMIMERPDDGPEDRVIFDPLKPMIRKAPPASRFVSGAEFPTEWTLDQ